MLKQFFSFMLMCGVFISISGFSAWSITPQESVATPDETLYETGMKYLENDQYKEARLTFQTLINAYPDSDLTAPSYFAIGDSYYNEGGTDNLSLAEKQYENFIIFFPKHPKVPDAQMKIISSNMKLMETPDRDRKYKLRAEEIMKSFLEQYPDSEVAPRIREWRKNVRESPIKTEQIDTQEDPHNSE